MLDQELLYLIKDTVYKTPGVKCFANYKAEENASLKTDDITKAIFINEDEVDNISLHLILMSGFNMLNVMRELQYKIKFVLEKSSNYTKNYIVDLIVDDIISE